MNDIDHWNETLGIADTLHFDIGRGGLPVVQIHNDLGEASIAVQGAHLLHFCPKGGQDMIWMSPDAAFAAGKSLRGGVPLCWPWFGAHEHDAQLPSHGYARTRNWTPFASKQHDDGSTSISFVLNPEDSDVSSSTQPLRARLHIRVGTSLNIQLETTNLGTNEVRLSEALHTYFHVGDVQKTAVHGLDGCDYLDKTDGFQRKQQEGAVHIGQEVDRVYLQTPNKVSIKDDSLHRTIIIESTGSQTTVVWNPWLEIAEKMGDLGTDGYRHMLCVETANAADGVVIIAAGDSHTMSATYSIA